MLILINIDIVIVVLDLIYVCNFHGQTIVGVKKVVTFGVNYSSFVHVDNKRKDILVLGEVAT